MIEYVGLALAVVMLCSLAWNLGHYMGGRHAQRVLQQQRYEIDRLSSELSRWTDRDSRGRFVRRDPK